MCLAGNPTLKRASLMEPVCTNTGTGETPARLYGAIWKRRRRVVMPLAWINRSAADLPTERRWLENRPQGTRPGPRVARVFMRQFPRFARTQAEGLRLCRWVRSSMRRVVLSLPREAPYVSEWLQIARSLSGADLAADRPKGQRGGP